MWWMDEELYPGLDFQIDTYEDFLDLPEGFHVKVFDRNWRQHVQSEMYSWQGKKVGWVREVEEFVATGDFLLTIEVKHFKQTGLPWSDPNSDPLQDIIDAVERRHA